MQGKRLVAQRSITLDLYETDAGHAEIIARFLDPYHLITLEVTLDPATRTVLAAEAAYPNAPFHRACPAVAGRAASLVGLTIGRGVMKEVARRLGGPEGCVHLRELAMEVVNFAATSLVGAEHGFGIMSPEFNRRSEAERRTLSLAVLRNTCAAYRDPVTEATGSSS
ncbi:MAG: DUF2889 domain-containing protein [Myxococcales bacterium]|nr:DUF2889 domain-containing protein [Myxococcales bacterium]